MPSGLLLTTFPIPDGGEHREMFFIVNQCMIDVLLNSWLSQACLGLHSCHSIISMRTDIPSTMRQAEIMLNKPAVHTGPGLGEVRS